jgi:hypothetical protein
MPYDELQRCDYADVIHRHDGRDGMAWPKGKPRTIGADERIIARVPAALRARLEQQAADAGKTLSDLIRERLEVEPEERASA